MKICLKVHEGYSFLHTTHHYVITNQSHVGILSKILYFYHSHYHSEYLFIHFLCVWHGGSYTCISIVQSCIV